MSHYVYSRCPECGHNNVHVHNNRLAKHYDLALPAGHRLCPGSGHKALEAKVIPTGPHPDKPKYCLAVPLKSVRTKAKATKTRLARFGLAVLEIMEQEQDWSADTMADIAREAVACGLTNKETGQHGLFEKAEGV